MNLRNILVVFEPVRENTKSQSLGFRHGLFPCRSVRENTGQFGNLTDPPPVLFALDVDVELAHGWEIVALVTARTLTSSQPPWAELVSFAMDFWDQADVEAALGAELADVLPELLQLAELEVRIPRLEIAALERIAVRDGRSVDAVLARELRDLVSAESAWLVSEIPGFAAALSWPE